MNSIHNKIILGILIAIVIISSIAVASAKIIPSGYIAYPFPCTISFKLEAPSSIDIYQGGSGEAVVTIKEVMCGISHVELELQNVPENYFSIEPALVASIAPMESTDFTISFDVPEDAETKTYLGTYYIKTNEGWFLKGETEIEIKEPPEKPAAELPALEGPPEEARVSARAGLSGWWIVGMLAAILAILVIGSEYFERTRAEGHKPPKIVSEKELGAVLNEYKRKRKR